MRRARDTLPVPPLLRADHQEAARGVMANGDDVIDRLAVDEAMARGDSCTSPHDDAMRGGAAGRVADDCAARRHRLDLGPQRHHLRVAARHAAGAIHAFDRRLEHEAAVELSRLDHSDSTRYGAISASAPCGSTRTLSTAATIPRF